MKRTTVFLSELVECDLRALARHRGRPVAELVREAVAEYVAREKTAVRPPLRFVGIGDSGESDVSERHEELVFRSLSPHGEGPLPAAAPRARAATRRKR